MMPLPVFIAIDMYLSLGLLSSLRGREFFAEQMNETGASLGEAHIIRIESDIFPCPMR